MARLMGYSFGAANSDHIAVSGLTAWTTKLTIAVRMATTVSNTAQRGLFYNSAAACYFDFVGSDTNGLRYGWQDTTPTYLSAWTLNPITAAAHTLVGVIDTTLGSANTTLYQDTSATPLTLNGASTTSTLGPNAALTTATIGGDGGTNSFNGTLYEVAVWVDVALSAAQAAVLGAGGPLPADFPVPTHYWPLITDAADLYGGADGTVTGATLVADYGWRWFPVQPTAHFTVGNKTQMKTGAAITAALDYWPDSGGAVLNNGNGTYTFIASHGGATNAVATAVGTFSDPFSVSTGSVSISGALSAPDGDPPFHYQAGGPVYVAASNLWIMMVHNELVLGDGTSFPSTQFYSWLSLAKSTNQGTSWTDCGTIITPHHTFAELQAQYAGYGKSDGSVYRANINWGPYLVVGDYLYIYFDYVDGPITSSGLENPKEYGSCVARALLADVVSAAGSGTVPTFHKYNAGTWTELGIRGTASPAVIPRAHIAVSYNTWRNRYIAMQAFEGDPTDTGKLWFKYFESLDGITWTKPGEEVATTDDFPPYHIYWTIADPDSAVPQQCGQTFYLLGKDATSLDLDRWLITLDSTDHQGLIPVLAHAGASRAD